MKIYGRIVGRTKCLKCGRVIAVTRQIETPNGYEYVRRIFRTDIPTSGGLREGFAKAA